MITDPILNPLIKHSHQLQYCIQEHRAPHAGLHWDLRLEWQGVAKSWALRKEPPMLLGVKRLAIPVNDHPLSYMDYENPQSLYYVKLWDHGTYSILNHSDTWILELHGSRLRGLFVLTPFRENSLFYRLK